jgi:hypothetical protein
MADYYPPIAQAVRGLERNTVATRRSIYDRACAAMAGQLRGLTPALSETEINRELIALETAIKRVEMESLSQARTPSTFKGQPEPPSRSIQAPDEEQAVTSRVPPKHLRWSLERFAERLNRGFP